MTASTTQRSTQWARWAYVPILFGLLLWYALGFVGTVTKLAPGLSERFPFLQALESWVGER